jgi:hypothetical protein
VPDDDAVFARLLSNGRALFSGQGSTCVPTAPQVTESD